LQSAFRLWRRLLINEIAANHEARAPEGLARNQLLIRELNDNVAKVMNVANSLSLTRNPLEAARLLVRKALSTR